MMQVNLIIINEPYSAAFSKLEGGGVALPLTKIGCRYESLGVIA